jgi:glycosyltransferase involved in cell wall biosynthesis
MYDFTIIVPVYNEEENLPMVEKVLIEYLNIAILKTSVLFVNDGSTDGGEALIKDICNRHPAFKFISFKKNMGLSTALKAGFDSTESTWLGYMDSDLQTLPEDFNLLLKHIDEYELITGFRSRRKDSFGKHLSSKVANGFRRFFTQDGISDTGCPLKVIKTDLAKRIPMFKGLHRFLPAMILLQKGRVLEIPIQHYPRNKGVSKFGFWNRSFGPLTDCFIFLWIRNRYINYEIQDSDL